jgi:ribosomal protein S6
MNKYELTVIFATSENEVSSEKRITDLIKKLGLKVSGLDKWGVKTMSYPMKGEIKGYYLFYTLEGEGEKAVSLEKDLSMDENVLRFLLIKC